LITSYKLSYVSSPTKIISHPLNHKPNALDGRYQLLYNNMRVNKHSNETTGNNTATAGGCEI